MKGNIPYCKYLIDQRVMSPIGAGTVQGVFRENGKWFVIVKHDESVRPADPIPEPRGFTLYHFDESELAPVEPTIN